MKLSPRLDPEGVATAGGATAAQVTIVGLFVLEISTNGLGHEHENDPVSSVQIAFCPHLLAVLHSGMSSQCVEFTTW